MADKSILYRSRVFCASVFAVVILFDCANVLFQEYTKGKTADFPIGCDAMWLGCNLCGCIYIYIYGLPLSPTEIKLSDVIWQLFTGHSETINPTMWYHFVLIWQTCLFMLAFSVLCGKKLAYFMAALFCGSLVLQYTGTVEALFGGMRYELKYPLARLVGLLPCAVLGIAYRYWLDKYGGQKKWWTNPWYQLALLLILCCLTYRRTEPINNYYYGGIFSLAFAMMLLIFFREFPFDRLPDGLQKLIVIVSNYTMGIYCMHRLIGRFLVVVGLQIGFVFCILLFVICWMISAAVTYLPGKKFWKILVS